MAFNVRCLVRLLSVLVTVMAVVPTASLADAATCQNDVPDAIAAADLPNAVTLDKGLPHSRSEAGSVFTIPTPALSKQGTRLMVCVRWRPRDADAAAALKKLDQNAWSPNLPVRVIDSKTDITRFGVELPPSIASLPADQWPPAKDDDHGRAWPRADVRVLVAAVADPPVLDEIIPVSITGYWIAALIALTLTTIFWGLVWGFARRNRIIPGGPILGVICNPNGYASLSQLQIMVWTLLIGGASIYIMVLTGRLLDIPTQTLALLGIAGAATVAASVPKAGAGAGGPTPGKVTRLRTIGSAGPTSVVLTWGPPNGGEPPESYSVAYRTPPGQGAWTTPAGAGKLPDTFFEVDDLNAATSYEFQVTASNANGSGPGSSHPS